MASDDVLRGALVGAAVGAAAVAIGTTVAKRNEFRALLDAELHHRDVELVNNAFGRNDEGAYWQLTVRHPRVGVEVLIVRLGSLDPYSPQALEFVVDRVAWWAQQAA